MENILIRSAGGHRQACPTHTHIRVTCHLGSGDLRYVTDDGFAGVHLDGEANERRVDEVPVAQVRQVHRIGERGGLRISDLVMALRPLPTTRQLIPVIDLQPADAA